jgi:hypothetical protein
MYQIGSLFSTRNIHVNLSRLSLLAKSERRKEVITLLLLHTYTSICNLTVIENDQLCTSVVPVTHPNDTCIKACTSGRNLWLVDDGGEQRNAKPVRVTKEGVMAGLSNVQNCSEVTKL